MAALWLDIEDEQDWKLNNHKCHPPRDCGERGMGGFFNEQAAPNGLVWDWME